MATVKLMEQIAYYVCGHANAIVGDRYLYEITLYLGAYCYRAAIVRIF